MTAPLNALRTPPVKAAGAVLLVILLAVFVAIFFQFRGEFTPKTQLTMIAGRAGLSMDKGGKVTYNGVEIARRPGSRAGPARRSPFSVSRRSGMRRPSGRPAPPPRVP